MQVCKLSVLHDLLGTGNDFSCLCVWKCWSGENLRLDTHYINVELP